jgi:hypothetical protein
MPVKHPHTDRCFRISRVPGDGPTWLNGRRPGPRGIHRNQGKSQRRLMRPTTIKNDRHPNRAINIPPNSIPKAGPEASPEAITELAKPRWDSGKCFASILEYEG